MSIGNPTRMKSSPPVKMFDNRKKNSYFTKPDDCSAESEYIPGSPGGAWSQEELLSVRAKLWRLYSDDFVYSQYNHIPDTGLPSPSKGDDLGFFPAKVLRLSFHDCVRYTDGGGGCDGCLNWDGVGTRYDSKALKFQFLEENINQTNNNGLEYTVVVLEELYTNKDFPSQAPSLSMSLKASGKSRADLWSYAAKVAVEYAVEHNNYQCEGMPGDWSGSYIGEAKDCLRKAGEPDCEVRLPREIEFHYGRRDCVTEDPRPYKTTRQENQPNPEGNGDATLDWFQSEFGFNGRETVAILGAHTLGRMHASHSLYSYVWTVRAGHSFNNAYYENFVKKTEWFIQSSDNNTCTRIGDAYGNIPDTRWVPTMEGFTKSGGPMHWIRMHYSCPYCGGPPHNVLLQEEYEECCLEVPDSLYCVPDPDTTARIPEEDITGCERYRFSYGKDEMMINAEMGLYLQFDVQDGIPKNCSGLDHFNMEYWQQKPSKDTWRRAYDIECPLNLRSVPAGDDLPVAALIQSYAKDQDLWISDFIPTFERMMSNGYDPSELTEGPMSWNNVICSMDNSFITCDYLRKK